MLFLGGRKLNQITTWGANDPARSPACHTGGSAFEPVTTLPNPARLTLGLFYVQNLAPSILKAMPNDYPMAYALQIRYPIPLDW